MGNYYLHEKIGTVSMVVEPDAYTSVIMQASDNDTPIPIGAYGGYDHVLFILQVGDITAGGWAAGSVGVMYSCDANGSNATAGTDVWAASDAYFPAVTSDGENEVYLLDFDIAGKGLPISSNDGNGGYLFVGSTVAVAGVVDAAVLAIPYGANRLPSTNENTVTYIGETST